jgi:nitroreductase
VIQTKEHEAELRKVYGREWFTQAPLVLAVSAIPPDGWVRKTDGWNAAVVDATIAMTHLILAAAEEGLGTCWIAAFDPKTAREFLKSSANEIPCAFTPLGYAADSPTSKTRRPLSELVRYQSRK